MVPGTSRILEFFCFFCTTNHIMWWCTWMYVLTRNTPPPRRFGSSYLINERFTYYRRLNYYDPRTEQQRIVGRSVEREDWRLRCIGVIKNNTTYLVNFNYTITSTKWLEGIDLIWLRSRLNGFCWGRVSQPSVVFYRLRRSSKRRKK